MERIMKDKIAELTNCPEIVREKLTSIEGYVIFVENKYVNAGGKRNTLIRPFTFAAVEELHSN